MSLHVTRQKKRREPDFPVQQSITLKRKPRSSQPQLVEQTLDDETLDKLRIFDLTVQFGPSIGMSRLDRWNRAYKLGLNPPREIKQILENLEEDSKYKTCIWEGRV
eukprot:TRINITY_DN408_c0_g1_i1.p3 TRINITY_DN408_c0_g1~~TRINITY_DN408_c0_g1_i1.p3  ORF type:complete len:106 (-),score=11.03 TRINITY_DN408_c0_g1_i1:337-654(-)